VNPAIASWPQTAADGLRSVWRRSLIWGTCFLAVCFLVRAYPLRDADSVLYEAIARSLEAQPLRNWVAPRWPAAWPSGQGLFIDHLAVFFWPAAALGKLGLRGALAANFLWTLLSFALLFRLARAMAGEAAAILALIFYAASPASLEYLVRANHEPALACAYLGALWCVADERPRPQALAGFLLLAVAVKGALGLLVFPTALAGWLLRRRREDLRGLLLGGFSAFAFAALYEAAFEKATGGSFFLAYLPRQFSGVLQQEAAGTWNKLVTPAYYAGSIAWFGLPGTGLVALDLARPRGCTRSWPAALLPVVACAGVLSLMARRAVRYVFPAFALCNAAGAAALLERAPRVRALLLDNREAIELALAVFLVAATAVRVAL
jgi:hypothetical protein